MPMYDLPVMLKIEARRCVVVGGGRVACRRAASLLEAGAEVVVISPRVDSKLVELDVTIHQRGYESGDLDGAFLVVVATNDPQVNSRVGLDAQAAGVLTNRADDPNQGDVVIPAHARHGPVTVAVSTGGVSAEAASTIRRYLSNALDPDWPRLLQIIAPYRTRAVNEVPDPLLRRQQLKRLASAEALDKLKMEGESGLHQYCLKTVANEAD